MPNRIKQIQILLVGEKSTNSCYEQSSSKWLAVNLRFLEVMSITRTLPNHSLLREQSQALYVAISWSAWLCFCYASISTVTPELNSATLEEGLTHLKLLI